MIRVAAFIFPLVRMADGGVKVSIQTDVGGLTFGERGVNCFQDNLKITDSSTNNALCP
jgi:hypothetical protein